jgi:hypothetical protein
MSSNPGIGVSSKYRYLEQKCKEKVTESHIGLMAIVQSGSGGKILRKIPHSSE